MVHFYCLVNQVYCNIHNKESSIHTVSINYVYINHRSNEIERKKLHKLQLLASDAEAYASVEVTNT